MTDEAFNSLNIEQYVLNFLNENYIELYQSKLKKACEKLDADLNRFMELYYQEKSTNLIAYITFRVKEPNSLLKKILRNKDQISKYEDIRKEFDKINDFAGVRYSCPYSDQILESVVKIRDFLKTHGYNTMLSQDKFKDHNTLKNVTKAGYRSYQYFVETPITVDSSGSREFIPVEIQVRSELQNTWAIKSHELIYKPKIYNPSLDDINGDKISDKIFNDCKAERKIQSHLLNIVDDIFNNIRKKLEREVQNE